MKRYKLEDGTVFTLTDADIIGVGYEAVVSRWKRKAVKIYQIDPTEADARHFEKLMFFKKNNYANTHTRAIYPEDIVSDEWNNYAGGIYRLADGEQLDELHDKGKLDSWSMKERLQCALAIALLVHEVHSIASYKICLCDGLKLANIIYNKRRRIAYGIDTMSYSACGFRPVGRGNLIDAICTLTTPGYISLERLQNNDLKPTKESDLYSLAVCLFIVFYGVHPFDAHPLVIDHEKDQAVLNGHCFRYTQVSGVRSPDFKIVLPIAIDEMLKRGLLGKPSERPTAEEFINVIREELWQYSPSVRIYSILPTRRQAAACAASLMMGAGLTAYLMAPPTSPAMPAPPQKKAAPLPQVPVSAPAPTKQRPKETIGPPGLDVLSGTSSPSKEKKNGSR